MRGRTRPRRIRSSALLPTKASLAMRYCHELHLDDADYVTRDYLLELLLHHAHACARGDADRWSWDWGDNRVVLRFQHEGDAMLSARTLKERHDFFSDRFCISEPLYQAEAVYAD